MKIATSRLLAAVVLVCLSGSAFAQAVSQISGTAKDPSGAVVPGVEISATQTDTGLKRATTTDESGAFIFPNLPLGPYKLEATKMGFRSYVQTGIVLQVGTSPEINIAMGVGQVSESVQVEANAAQVETRNVGVGNVIESQRILELPLNGRQPTDLIPLSGAAVQTAFSPGYTMRTGVRVAVAGGHEYSVQYNLDGASHLETYGGTGMPLPFPEALQEFKLVTSTQDASGSGHSSASVNGVTKSGTNNFHGDVFYFIRNAALNGRDFFARTDDKLKRNQFGGVMGGAIKKDKLFYFVGYQGTLVRQTPSGTINFVPTAKMLQGDFSDYVTSRCGNLNAGVLDANSRFTLPMSAAARNIAAKLPAATNACGLIVTGNPLSENQLQVPVRLDYQMSEKQSFFARYLVTRIDTKLPYDINPADVITSTGVGADDMSQSLALGDTYVFGPTLVNSFRIFGNRVGSFKPHADTFGPSDVGVQNYYTYIPNFMSFAVTGGFSIGTPSNFSTSTTGYTNFGFNDDVNWIRGAHQFSFGVNAMRAVLVGNSYAWAPGFFAFTGGVTGQGLADFLTGRAAQLHQANPNPNYSTQNFLGLYAADVWKVNSRLTVNYGIRWNPFIPLQFMQSDTTNFSLTNFYGGIRSKVVPNAPPGFSFPGDEGFAGRSGMNSALNHFEPRVGIAFDPFGDGKTAIRAGVGTAYDFIFQGVHQNTSSVNPYRITVLQNNVLLDNPYANVPGGNPFPYTYDKSNLQFRYLPDYQGFYLMPKDLRTTQQYQWNIGIQRQFTQSLFASATYIGSQLIHTWTAIDLNPGQFIPGTCSAGQYGLAAAGPCSQLANINQRRLLNLNNPAAAGTVIGTMTNMDDGGTQRYNALLLTATYRKPNLNLSANYTWSHCYGLPYTTVANIGAAYTHEQYQNNGPVDRAIDYGDCVVGNLDQRHIANITAVINTGKGVGNSIAKWLTSNWSVSTIYTARSGWAVTPYLATDRAVNGIFANAGGYQIAQRPNQVLVDTASPTRGQGCSPAPCVSWLNPSAFALPDLGAYGNMGTGSVRAPGFFEWDQALIRGFRVREGQNVEFRAEAFNVTNSPRFYMSPAPNGDNSTRFGTAQFGTIFQAASTTGSTSLSGSGGRVLQFALKYVF
ncbi:MAG: carboxypeptidase regulatory-like domain-containing protein [Bryobacteraceae bacterium]